MRALAIVVLLVGCAKAGPGGGNNLIDGNNPNDPDGHNVVDDTQLPDTPPPIDGPVSVTMAETTSPTVQAGPLSISCHDGNNYSRTNSYYRVFTLTDYGVAGKFHVNQVSFAIEQATAGAGGQQAAQLKVGTYDIAPVGTTLNLASITPINSANIQIANGTGTLMNVPITADIPAGTNIIVELAIPDGQAAHNIFFIGANTGGQSKDGYIRSTDCSLASPTTLATVAAGAGITAPDIIVAVTGTH